MEMRQTGVEEFNQDPEMLTTAETRQLAAHAWRYLNHLEPFRNRNNEGFGVESVKVLADKIKNRVMKGKTALVACVGPSASGKSTTKNFLNVAFKTDPDIRKYRKDKRTSIPIISTQWSDMIKAYSAITDTPVEFGKLPHDFKAGVSRLGRHELEMLHTKLQGQRVPAVIIADFPGYPGNRGDEIAEYIAQNDGFVIAPWGEHHLYRVAAHMRDVARNTDDATELAELLEEQGLPILGSPEEVHRQLTQDCAPGFAVLNMQDQMTELALQLNEQGGLNTHSGGLPRHWDYAENHHAALVQDPIYRSRVMGEYVIPTLLQNWGFDSGRSFVGYNERILNVSQITEDKLNSIR